jgi:hypothetical protein
VIELSATAYTPLTSATWTCSDGVALSGLTVARAFTVPGIYTATLTATDIYGFTYQAGTTVTVYGAGFLDLFAPRAIDGSTPFPLSAQAQALLASAQAQAGLAPMPLLQLQPSQCPNGFQIVNGVFVCSPIPIDPRGLPGSWPDLCRDFPSRRPPRMNVRGGLADRRRR